MASRNLDEALVRLDNTMHSMTLNMDKLLNRLTLVPSSITPNPTPVPRHSTSVPAQIRYAPSPYEDLVGVLFKLTQTGSVLTYLKEFEDLANRIIGLPAPFLLPCFISGLTLEIRRAVQAHQPMTVDQVTDLAKIQEQKLSVLRLPPPQLRPHRQPLWFPLVSPLCPICCLPHHRLRPSSVSPQRS